jgi:hypothetical protein
MKLIEIVHELRLANGSSAKIDILSRHTNNTLWKRFLYYTYNEQFSYGVSSPSTFDFDACEIDDEMFDSFDDLRNRRVTGNAARDLARDLSARYGEIPRLILARTVKAGISTTTVNKVYKNLIPVFKTMKGKDVPIVEYPVFSSIKYDGVKIFVFNYPDSLTIMTSNGGIIPRFDSLSKEIQRGPFGVYEGEMIYKEGRQVDRSVITGKLNSLLAGTVNDITDYSYMIYDFVEMEDWDMQAGDSSFIDRQGMLEAIFEVNFEDSFYVKKVEHFIHKTEEEVIEFFEFLVSRGYEGSMHRYAADPYMWTGDRRTDRLVKKKSIRECVLRCTGTVAHSNPAKGITGSLVCEGTINDKIVGRVDVAVNVGSGMSKFEIMQDSEYFVNKDIEILYNSVTEVDGMYSLFLPRFKRIVGNA